MTNRLLELELDGQVSSAIFYSRMEERGYPNSPKLEELAKNSNQKQTINFLRASINKCRALKRTLAKRLKYIVDGNLFYDLRPDLAEHARGGFLSQAISKGPDVVNKYIYLLRAGGNNRKKWKSMDWKLGISMAKAIESEYKFANCEHIRKPGPDRGFGPPAKPDEEILDLRNKCREEKNLPTK